MGSNRNEEVQLPAATEDVIERLREKGQLLCVSIPAVDVKEQNSLSTVYFAEYEHGTEVTLEFKDEDNPGIGLGIVDAVYDSIREPLFGRKCDIETFFIFDKEVEFPGTYAGKQTWEKAKPEHVNATVELSKFERKDENLLLVWVNTWNHLMGEVNNNSTSTEEGAALEQVFCNPIAAGSTEGAAPTDYVVRKASRSEVDDQFKGLMTSVEEVMTPEIKEKLGKRVS